jgi:hypothetical protein
MTRRKGTASFRRWGLIAAAVAVVYGIHAWITTPLRIARAIETGKVAAVGMFGGAGSLSTITVTRTPGTSGAMTMLVPAGTVLHAGDASVQRVMTAATVTIVLPAGADVVSATIATFCLDEFAAVPEVTTSLSLSPGPGDRRSTIEETEPLHKLADCMASLSRSDDDKQVAIWAVKDDLLHKSSQDALAFLGRGFEDQIAREFRAKVDLARASIAQEARDLSAAEVDAQIADTMRAEEAANRTEAARLARTQLDSLLLHRDLLTSCGYAEADMPIFR